MTKPRKLISYRAAIFTDEQGVSAFEAQQDGVRRHTR
jgi:hypothetical protein